jgi:hypothetical protein
MADPADRELVENTGTPRWVIVSVVIALIVVLVVVMMLVFGHGPGRHGG